MLINILFSRSAEESACLANAEESVLNDSRVYSLYPAVTIVDAQRCRLLVAAHDIRVEVILDVQVCRTADNDTEYIYSTFFMG